MSATDQRYYRRRIDNERARAKAATDITVKAIHLTLAQEYETLLESGPTLHVVRDG